MTTSSKAEFLGGWDSFSACKQCCSLSGPAPGVLERAVPQSHLCTAPLPTITACCPQAWAGTERIHGCSSARDDARIKNSRCFCCKQDLEKTLNGLPGAGCDRARGSSWADPSAVQNTSPALRVVHQSKQRASSLWSFPSVGVSEPHPRQGRDDGASTREGRPEISPVFFAQRVPEHAAVTLVTSCGTLDSFIPRAASALAEKLPGMLGLLCQEEVLAAAWDNEGHLWRCPGPGVAGLGTSVSREGLSAWPCRSAAAGGRISSCTQRWCGAQSLQHTAR